MLIVPLLALVLLIEVAARRERTTALALFDERGKGALERLAASIDTERGVLEPLLQIGHLITTPMPKGMSLDRRLAPVTRRIAGSLDVNLYYFSNAGVLIGCEPEKAENQWMFKKIVAGLGEAPQISDERRKEIDRLLRSIFGFGHSLNNVLLSQGRPQTVMYKSQAAWFFWERGTAGGVFVVCRRWPSDLERFRDSMSRPQDGIPPGTLIGYRPAGVRDWTTCGRGSDAQMQEIWRQLRAGDRSKTEWAGRRCFVLSTRGGGTLLAAFSVPDSLKLRPMSAASLWCLFLGLPLVAAFGFGRDRFGTIRRALIMLFLITALVPTAGLVTETTWTIELRRAVLESEVLRAQHEALRALDQGFQDFRIRLERKLANLLQRSEFYRGESVQVPEVLEKLMNELGGNYDLRSPEGRILIGSGGPWGLGMVANSLLMMVMEIFIPERLPAVRPRIDPVLDGALREQRTGFWNIAQRPLRLLELTTGKRVQYLFWHYFADPMNPASAFIAILPGENLVRWYLREAVAERYDCWGTIIRLQAVHLRRHEQIPAETGARTFLREAAYRASVLGSTVSGTMVSGFGSFRYLIVPGQELKDYALCALFPVQEIEQRVQDLRWRLRMGAGLSMFAALLVGALLAQTLLRPMEDLSEGIAALAEKRFDVSVPVRRHDELGALALAFNQMTVELKDLNMAGAVQAALIPREYPAVAGYDVQGRVLFAGDLGGDCLDCRLLPDGRLFFLIGDVSGHGAASALIMAFTRAIVTLWIRDGQGDMSRLVNRLQVMLSTLPGRRLFLALYCGLLDPRSHRITAQCAGHPFPVSISGGGVITWHGRPAYPLGSYRGARGGVQIEYELKPDEMLLLYTDGLVEARDSEGKEFAYSGLESFLRQHANEALHAGRPADEMVGLLTAEHQRRSTRAEDDVSLLAIVRLGGAHS